LQRTKIIFIKLLTVLIFLLGITLLLFQLAYFTREGTKMVEYYRMGSVQTELETTADSLFVFSRVYTRDFVAAVHPVAGDTLVAVNDSSAVPERVTRYLKSPLEPGEEFPLRFVHQGDTLQTTVRAEPPKPGLFYQILLLQIIRTLLALGFIAVGLWAFLKRSDSAGIRALVLFCLSMAGFFTFGVSVLSGRYAAFDIPGYSVFQVVFGLLMVTFGSFWLNLQLLFPRPKKALRNHPVWTYLIVYFPIPVLILLQLIGLPSIPMIYVLIIALQITIGFVILAASRRHAPNSLERRQTGLVLWGTGIGLTSLFLLLVISIGFRSWFSSFSWSLLIINIFLAPLLLSPISFAYAFGRYRLLEVEGKIRRGTRYFAVTVVMLALMIGTVYLIGDLLIRRLGITDRTPTFMVALVLALGFIPAWRRVQTVVEHHIYPERHHLRAMIGGFLQQIISIPDRETLWSRLHEQLRQSFGINAFYPIVRQDGTGFFFDQNDQPEPTPFQDGQEIVETLRTACCPILVDEALSSGRVVINRELLDWIERHRIALLVPMIIQSRLIGLLALGEKIEGEDFSPEDLKILESVASQVALARENIRLIEDNLDKKRMEEELKFAQRIQKGFLPAEIPPTPGLDIAAESQFCLEVAGDYYDIIGLPDGKSVLAVGDVSGKGAGAALIMANLQASLRTVVGVTTNLSDAVRRINDLIYDNTPPEQYITFFVALFDPGKKQLTYVNAGHNPPLLVQKEGEVELLQKGGLILGAVPGVPFEQDEVRLQTDDLLLIYTDGLSEAMNADGEEFGEERILNLANHCRHLSPSELLECLKTEARKFTGDGVWQDDLTLLSAKVK
jgi:serine phosphatase RsbU (regulator of sigma subunit)